MLELSPKNTFDIFLMKAPLSRRAIRFVHVSPGFLTFWICHSVGFVARFEKVN